MKTIVLALALTVASPGAPPSSGGGGPAPQEAPEAVVLRVTGDVEVHPPSGDPVSAAVGTRLSAGDRIVPAAGGSAVVVYRDGTRTDVTAETTVEAPEAGGGGDAFTRTVRVLAQAATSNARHNPNRQGMIRPIPGEPTPVTPRRGLRVMEVRPTFTWRAVNGAEGYVIQIRTEGERPVRYTTGPDTTWTLPADAPPLERGREYRWTVAPTGGGRPAMETSFRVIPGTRAEEVTWNLSAIDEMGLDRGAEGGLLAATVYTDFGLYYAALDALEALETDAEVLAPDVYMLKGEVLNALGEVDAAREAFDRADRAPR